jgi:predicted ABC-type ATPase
MKRVIIIEGPCGAGKSAAIQAARVLRPGLAFVDLDGLKDATFRLGDRMLWEESASSLGIEWRRKLASEVGIFWLEKLIIMGRQIAIELCDTLPLQSEICTVATNHGYEIVEYLLMPPMDICLVNNKTRSQAFLFDDDKVRSSYTHYSKKCSAGYPYLRVVTHETELVALLIEECLPS